MAKVGYVQQVKAIGVDSLKAGIVGGVPSGVLAGFLGPLGGIIGSILGGAAIGGMDGRIVAINGVQDGITAAIYKAMRGR